MAKDDEWLFEVDLAMIDTHGCPQCKAEALVGGKWVTVSESTWKPNVNDRPYSAKLFPVALNGVPTALRLTATGYGDCGLCHVSLRNSSHRFVPSKIVSTEGRVQDAENLLIDDFRGMRFGFPDCTAAFLHEKKAGRRSTVTLSLEKMSAQETCAQK